LGQVRSLDPAQASSPEELLVADQLFDGLTAFDPGGTLRSAISSSWQTTPDQAHWDFVIRPDAHFANGRAITSVDVKYSLERIAHKGSTSPVALQLDRVVGFKAFYYEGKAPGLAGITTPAPDRVHFDVDQPVSVLPFILANPAFGIVAKEAVEAPAPAFADQPVGSGPFMLASRTIDTVELVRAPGATTLLDGIRIRLFSGDRAETVSYAAFTRGFLDWTRVPPDRVEDVVGLHRQAGFRPYAADLFYGFNLKNPKFADARFREAIVRAVDPAAIVKVVYGGTARPATGVTAEGVPGYLPNACAKCSHDLAKAKELVAATFGSSAVPEVAIDYDDDPTQAAIARAMQANLHDAGIGSTIRPHAHVEYISFATSGKQELFQLGWIAPYLSLDAILTPLFSSGLPDNVTGFSVPDVDKLLKAARATPDDAARTSLYQQAERTLMDLLPIVPIAQFTTHSITSKRVRGLAVTPLGTFDATTVWLVPTKGTKGSTTKPKR